MIKAGGMICLGFTVGGGYCALRFFQVRVRCLKARGGNERGSKMGIKGRSTEWKRGGDGWRGRK